MSNVYEGCLLYEADPVRLTVQRCNAALFNFWELLRDPLRRAFTAIESSSPTVSSMLKASDSWSDGYLVRPEAWAISDET